jgi:hypothetical protein
MIDEVTQAWLNAGAPGPGLLRRADEVAEINAANGDISHPAILAGAPQALSTTAFQVVPRLAAAALAVRLAAMSSEDLPLAEFGFPGPLRDQLVAAILAGDKTTTTGLVADYEIGNEPLPRPGVREAVVDSAGKPVAVIETTAVRVIRLGDVDCLTRWARVRDMSRSGSGGPGMSGSGNPLRCGKRSATRNSLSTMTLSWWLRHSGWLRTSRPILACRRNHPNLLSLYIATCIHA